MTNQQVKKNLNICTFIFQHNNFTTYGSLNSIVEPDFEYYFSVILLCLSCAMLSFTHYGVVVFSHVVASCQFLLLVAGCMPFYDSMTFYLSFPPLLDYGLFPVSITATNVAMKIFVHVLMPVAKVSSGTGSANQGPNFFVFVSFFQTLF